MFPFILESANVVEEVVLQLLLLFLLFLFWLGAGLELLSDGG